MRNTNIEDAINLLHRLPRAIRQSMNHEILRPQLQSIDKSLSPHHMVIMKIVSDEGTIHIGEIAEITMIAKAQMTHSIDKLASLGMLERVPDPEDRRKTGIILTEKGNHSLAIFDAAVKDQMMERLSWLDDEKLEKLVSSLKFLLETLDKF